MYQSFEIRNFKPLFFYFFWQNFVLLVDFSSASASSQRRHIRNQITLSSQTMKSQCQLLLHVPPRSTCFSPASSLVSFSDKIINSPSTRGASYNTSEQTLESRRRPSLENAIYVVFFVLDSQNPSLFRFSNLSFLI